MSPLFTGSSNKQSKRRLSLHPKSAFATGKGRLVRRLCGCLCLICLAYSCLFVIPWMLNNSSVNDDDKNGSSRGGSKQRRRRRHRRSSYSSSPPPDATFNGGPVYLVRAPRSTLRSTRVHCVGETYQRQTAWKDRSCRLDHLFCYNTTARDFVVWESVADQQLAAALVSRPFHHVSSSLHRLNESNTVSLGGINQKWGKAGVPRLQWFPQIQTLDESDTTDLVFYALPDTTILIPFHSMNGANPGHLVWDDFLPIYTLLTMFMMRDTVDASDFDLLPLRFVLQDDEERGLWASCDLRPDKAESCRHMMTKFWALIAGTDSPYFFSSTVDSQLVALPSGATPTLRSSSSQSQPKPKLQSDLVCAKTGLVGLGSLTDHGLYKAHGWEEADYKIVQNAGRGGLLYNFRNFMLQNMEMDDQSSSSSSSQPRSSPHRIVFSQRSSDIFIRSMDFVEQIAVVKENFPDASVEPYVFKNMTLIDQLTVATRASVYITLCGGGAVTAMFLPAGASVIVYYAEDGGVSNGKMNHKPALLDWDLFNAMSHLRVHWLGRNSRKTAYDHNVLVQLIRHELAIMDDLADEQAAAARAMS